jgi:hypothetical protein
MAGREDSTQFAQHGNLPNELIIRTLEYSDLVDPSDLSWTPVSGFSCAMSNGVQSVCRTCLDVMQTCDLVAKNVWICTVETASFCSCRHNSATRLLAFLRRAMLRRKYAEGSSLQLGGVSRPAQRLQESHV